MASVVRMPQLAAGGDEAAIQAWLVAAGDEVAVGQPIAEIETEKAVVEYESEVEGTFAGALVPAGDSAPVGSPIAVVAAAGEALEAALTSAGGGPVAIAPPEPAPVAAAISTPASDGAPVALPDSAAGLSRRDEGGRADTTAAAGDRLFASPLVRRLAGERGVDLRTLRGSGPHGRIVRRDLDAYAAAAPPPSIAATTSPRVEEPPAGFTDVPHTGMRRAIARRLAESKSTVPHFYLVADTRVDELLALRAKVNEGAAMKVSVNDLVLKAVARALQDVPDANAIWTDDATRRFDTVDLAVAVSVPGGLLTPVVRDVEKLSLSALSATVRELAGRAREGRLKQHELEGGSFSVSNLGMYGTQAFSAIINPPHAGILAVGAASKRPIVTDEGGLGVGTVMTVTLSADHRVLDGALAAEWLTAFVERIENPLSILI